MLGSLGHLQNRRLHYLDTYRNTMPPNHPRRRRARRRAGREQQSTPSHNAQPSRDQPASSPESHPEGAQEQNANENDEPLDSNSERENPPENPVNDDEAPANESSKANSDEESENEDAVQNGNEPTELNTPSSNNSSEELIRRINQDLGDINNNRLAEGSLRATLERARDAIVQYANQKYQDIKDFKKENPRLFWTYVAIIVIGLSMGPIVGGALSAAGFTAGGVAGGSLAAAWQATIGNVVAGSLFAILQSICATGAVFTIFSVGGVALGGLGIAIFDIFRRCRPPQGSLIKSDGLPPPDKPSWGERMKAAGKAVGSGAQVVGVGVMIGACYTIKRAQGWWRK